MDDGLAAFEKQLAAEKAQREREEEELEQRQAKRHKHRHHHHDHRSRRDSERDRDRDRDGDREGGEHRRRDRSRNRDHRRDSRRDWHRENSNDDGEYRRRHHHRSRHHNDDGGDVGDDKHRDKRSRRSRDDEDNTGDDPPRDRHLKRGDPQEDLPFPDQEATPADSSSASATVKPLERDSWMTAPSALDIDYVQRAQRASKASTKPQQKEFAPEAESKYTLRMEPETRHDSSAGVDYTFGDYGSDWRMKKLDAVFRAAAESGRSVEDVALAQYGSLRVFDEAREEKDEMERRRVFGDGWVGKEKPTGDLYRERVGREGNRGVEPEQGIVIPDEVPAVAASASGASADALPPAAGLDQTGLNRMRAKMMKARLRKAPDADKLEAEYNEAATAFAAGAVAPLATAPPGAPPGAIVLGVMDNRQLAGARGEVKAVTNTRRGRERGLMEENTDMSLDDMVREERRTKGQAGGEGLRLAERIAKDSRFANDLEYMDENAERLARRVHKSDINLKNVAVGEFQRLNRALEACPLCHGDEDEDPATGARRPPRPPVAPVVSLGTRVFLTIPPAPELSPLGAVIAPLAHRTNLLECDDDEWEELRNFMKSLTRMHHDLGRDVVFYENAATPRRHRHAAMVAVSIPYEDGATAPAYFREAMLSADEEWAQHRKVIDTGRAAREGGMGRNAFRRSIAREMPYFHVWFSLDGGLGHVVEDEARWPRGDRFAREVLGGIMDVDVAVVKKEGRWRRGGEEERVDEFRRRWRKFDWTRVLLEGGEGGSS